MMHGASECGKLLGQEYNRPAEAGVLKKPREATLTLTLYTRDKIFHYFALIKIIFARFVATGWF
jgi:hypothetical protein